MQTVKDPQTLTISEPDFGRNKKRIGILGGTFNPPHLGHLIIAEQVADQLGLERVLFMPDSKPPHVDHKESISPFEREQMVELSIAGNDLFQMEKCELERGGISYTYDSIKLLQKCHPEYELYFIIGGDMVAYLPKWHKIEQLIKMVHFVGVIREGYPQKSQYPIMWVDIPLINISSTLIRQKLSQHCSIKYLVPDAVEKYIYERGLYDV
ncbi:nicotinate-nucleotide adenylyltransferase (Deamido-NAD(+) pyrophosphorylase) [Liquorilactobacillus aquaticus DSM 21051]|uniref:Probable nicotinate-nucleotide adenylyltransferase n=1 Tax=Liquorilactobacillus aquaticus DSM 21051 TaxID=1423725 RepID=A0A0R2CYP9_9LACO|nr:nicotinate-nucleotide adenylyltransferase [Liquorilactobacillus aquaticus]KRM96613.1 nicotinate-nucleotide adenylyltransferase (Deamido-NAD(+) pyrophosphorylase) [Liquorilactobacillus aquaticus DSM 21051]